MQFKIDENLPIEAARLLAQAGHEAKTVHEQQLVGRPDDQVAAVCHDEGRALVTIDLDFADIRAYPPEDYAGLVVLRPRVQVKHHILDLVRQTLPLLDLELLRGRLWIVSESGVRIRQATSSEEEP
ncbi:MAG: DUF5615 family PIN-like protein [Thermoguttaceae bacterium]|jgi:predicted nuclease of predicted toxin-antitoxin system